ncbi:MAG: AAA family ATPase [Candidatus Electrothrix scaldis]|nr:MAG: AAA family ATPase [Candidatus Electrothrix sp. GW3-3]
MYLQHFGLEHPPFTRQPSPDVFFVQAGRKNILKNLRDDLRQGEMAMLLTGPDGAGKTMSCRLIRHRLDGSSCKVVYLENPVGSFDDLLTQVCQKLGVPSVKDGEEDILSVLQALVQDQKEQGRRVLFLIDEAERMFLAALERLFRLLDELHEAYGTQALLVGQPDVNTSLEQLSGYCEYVRISSTYSLAAFSVEETATYLAYRLKAAGDTRGTSDPVFSKGAVQAIFRLGQGLPGLIDGIAESSLEKAAAAGEQTVRPVHVVAPDEAAPLPLAEDEEEERKGHKGILIFLFVLSLIAFLFWGSTSFFTGEKDTPEQANQGNIGVQLENTEISIGTQGEEPLPFVEEEGDDAPEEAVDSAESTGGPSFLALPVPERPDFKKKDDEDDIQEQQEEGKERVEQAIVAESSSLAEEQKAEAQQEASSEVPALEQDTPVEVQAEQKVEEPEQPVAEYTESPVEVPVLAPGELKHAAQEETSVENEHGEESETLSTAKKLPVIKPTSIIELTPGMKKIRPPASEESAAVPQTEKSEKSEKSEEIGEPDKPANAAASVAQPDEKEKEKEATSAPPKQKTLVPVASARVTTPAVSSPQASSPPPASEKEKTIPVPKIELTSVPPASPSAQADQLYARYLAAGNRWNKKDYGNKFTVQLLVLSSDDAAENIKEIVARDEYQEHSIKLHILRRDTQPPTLFVCYGVYSSMDEARNARNTMPLFLRKHHPYALSISDVLAKARD